MKLSDIIVRAAERATLNQCREIGRWYVNRGQCDWSIIRRLDRIIYEKRGAAEYGYATKAE